MSVDLKDERIDARILSTSLTGDEVQEALRDYFLRKAEVHDYERGYVDKAKSTVKFSGDQTASGVNVSRADVVVYLDKSREPRCAERMPPPSSEELTRLADLHLDGTLNTADLVRKIRELCQ